MNDSMNSVLFLFISGLEYISLCLEFIPKILVSIKLCFSIRVNLLKIDLLSLIIWNKYVFNILYMLFI